MKCVFDLEANGLLPEVHTVWCGVFTDINTSHKYKFKPYEIDEMLSFMDSCDTLIGHNVLGFDFPALKKVYDYDYKGTVVDTLVLSCLGNADRYGGHSVANWAKLLKLDQQKVEHEDWSKYTPEMLHRCSTDVDIQVEIHKAVFKELQPDIATFIDWELPMKIEHAIAAIISSQEAFGVPFNTSVAVEYLRGLEEQLEGIQASVTTVLGERLQKATQPIVSIFKIDGSHTSHVKKWFGERLDDPDFSIGGRYSKVQYDQVKLTMYGAVKQRLMHFGWQPTSFTEKGAPKMPGVEELEDLAESTGHPGIATIAKYGSIANRRNIIRKWIEIAQLNNNRLPAGAFTNGTNTGRFKHTVVVNVPRASSGKDGLIYYPEKQGSFFGTEMRSLFYNGGNDNYKVVGADAAGLELRCLAHFLNNKIFTETVLDGDVHTLFWEAAGGAKWIKTRNDMKSVTYAWLYGAGDVKISTLCTAKKGDYKIQWGRTVRRNLLKGVGGLAALVEAVVMASERGYLRGLDGRKVLMRKSNGRVQTHKALNTLLQSAGSILVKQWTILVNIAVKEAGLDAKEIIHMHDEMQWLCHTKDTKELSHILKRCMVEAGEFFNLNIALEADVQIGNNWAETH